MYYTQNGYRCINLIYITQEAKKTTTRGQSTKRCVCDLESLVIKKKVIMLAVILF